jgi:hypothetical protein
VTIFDRIAALKESFINVDISKMHKLICKLFEFQNLPEVKEVDVKTNKVIKIIQDHQNMIKIKNQMILQIII